MQKIQDTESSGNLFIDDCHDSLLLQLEAMADLLGDAWVAEVFQDAVWKLISNVESHFTHEETILKGAKYQQLHRHSMKHREISAHLRNASFNGFHQDKAIQFLRDTRSLIFEHEMLDDQDYWPVFSPRDNNTAPLIAWTKELETGDADTDAHHQALVRYINRIHEIFKDGTDIQVAVRELRALSEYSMYHFSAEEMTLGANLRGAHRGNHRTLIEDLNKLISEVSSGQYKLKNVGGYLRYWLLNHVETFDVPAFSR